MNAHPFKKPSSVLIVLALAAIAASADSAMAQQNSQAVPFANPTVMAGPVVGINFEITNNTTPTVTGTIDNPTAGIYVIIDKKTYRGINSGTGSWAAGVNDPLADGNYDVTVVAVPIEGTKAIMTAIKGLVIDSVAPKVTADTLITSDPSPALTGTIDDNMALIVVGVDGSLVDAINNGDGTWSVPSGTISPALKPGTYKITAFAADLAGNLAKNDAGASLTILDKNTGPQPQSPDNSGSPDTNPSDNKGPSTTI